MFETPRFNDSGGTLLLPPLPYQLYELESNGGSISEVDKMVTF